MTVQEYQSYAEGLYGIWLRIAESEKGYTYGYSIALPGLVLGHNLHKDHTTNVCYPSKVLAVEQGLYLIYLIIERYEKNINHTYMNDLAAKIIDKFFNYTQTADMCTAPEIPLIHLLWMM